ncbi:MAG: protein-glutamine glutaminase family protein [Bacteriovoracaceae bacterium]|jgi:hypothetical protein|nr:protein-glutamine glutaminase family protein [Bacteriovoracaceae bacterium]
MQKLYFILLFSLSAFSINYEPTHFSGDRQEVRNLFNSLWSKYKEYKNFHCYRKAHIISYQMKQNNINPVKVFVFNGDRATLPMNWWYHVAPAVYYKNKIVIMDRGLLDGASLLEDWLEAFTGHKTCTQVSDMYEYKQRKPFEKCLYIISDMYQYMPKDLYDFPKQSFEKNDYYDMGFVMSKRHRKRYFSLYPHKN